MKQIFKIIGIITTVSFIAIIIAVFYALTNCENYTLCNFQKRRDNCDEDDWDDDLFEDEDEEEFEKEAANLRKAYESGGFESKFDGRTLDQDALE